MKKMIELALMLSLGALLLALNALGYLDHILGNTLTFWFFWIILLIVLGVQAAAFAGHDVDSHFWSWLVTALGMLGTVLGFSMALAGIDVEALQQPAALTAEIGSFLSHVAFAVDTTLIGLSAALVMEALNKVRQILHSSGATPPQPDED